MPVFHIDGEPVEFEPGEKILSAALRRGKIIPHYCYHPGMSIVATCRMCVVDVIDLGNGRPAPKLQTACSVDAAEGMKVDTMNQKVEEGRKLVNEFLLINHPLDCPICDQSGECTLQDYSFEYGSGKSEMDYSKRVYGWRDIGTFVSLERNRCIQCSRCDRFTREITGTNEFGMFNRGHELTVDTFTDRTMTNKFQGNMADICPVGAITEKEFRFKRRAWKLKKNRSICTGCSTGCNVTIEHDRNEVFRLKPHENQNVNKWWMCDEGRLTYRIMNERKSRINRPLGRVGENLEGISWEEAYGAIAERVREMAPLAQNVIALTDTHASNEELFLIQKLLKDGFSSDNIFCPLPNWEQIESDFFINTLITTDKTPNRAGALALKIKGDAKNAKLKEAVKSDLKVVFVLGNPFETEHDLQQKIKTAQLVVHIGAYHNSWSEIADVVLPGQHYSEKIATYTNKQHLVQATDIAVKALRRSRPEWQILSELAEALGQNYDFTNINQVFDSMSRETKAFSGLNFDQIQSNGIELAQTAKDSGKKLIKAAA
ncbi:MAG: NADH-quinone oxidoreductase chain 3 [Deltaproteobacteria bacterium]|jgi:NADH-quinone oxidoreductase subunit G|nr:NADH-quinone oxidoreductase chain 3 [Deltaproteobacteria bacterium]